MITLEVKDYCQNCGNFSPVAYTTDISDMSTMQKQYRTYVVCEHEDLCARLYRHVKSEYDKEN